MPAINSIIPTTSVSLFSDPVLSLIMHTPISIPDSVLRSEDGEKTKQNIAVAYMITAWAKEIFLTLLKDNLDMNPNDIVDLAYDQLLMSKTDILATLQNDQEIQTTCMLLSNMTKKYPMTVKSCSDLIYDMAEHIVLHSNIG